MVVPIGFFDPEIDLFHPFGTGLYISEIGLLCTARHVFEFEDSFLETMRHLSDRAYPAIYQYYDNHTANMRPIVAAHGHPRFDVAVARVQPFHNLETGEPFKNNMLALTIDIMPIETRVHQYSYLDPVVFAEPLACGTQLMMIPLHTIGKVIDWLPEGMGRLFPSPCYVIEGYIGAGSSGGPVMDETGRVFAISSRGNAADNYYYAVPVQAIADIRVTSVMLSTPPEICGPTIKEMVTRRLISFVRRADESD